MSMAPTPIAASAPATAQPLVRLSQLSKRYGMTTVLDRVSLTIERGEVHAIVGENGAGKSTLAKCLSGFALPDGGEIAIDGQRAVIGTVEEAERRGIILIHQELALAEHLSVTANMFLGHEIRRGWLLESARMDREAAAMLGELGCHVDIHSDVGRLPVSDRQMVEIGKALLRKARLLIMDEPSAVLTTRETEHLFTQIERLRADGVSVIYVSHKLDEVKRIADRVSILRDGQYQGTWPIAELTTQQIANLMVGRELSEIYPPKSARPDRPVVLSVKDFLGEASAAPASFEVRAGEILGVAGLVGSGRTELFESLVGLRPSNGGQVELDGAAFAPTSFRSSIAAGIAYITEDRKGRGLLLAEAIAPNVVMLDQILANRKLVDPAQEERALEWATRQFRIEAPFPGVRVGRLSGGNQQKVLLAKYLINKPNIMIVDEPTRGIDVGTRAQIYLMLRDFANQGKAIVVISSDLQEIVGLSDRVMVMRENRVAGFLGADASEENIVQLATGVAEKTGRE
jgi:ribose transport system ATP-binding protein